MRAVPRCLTGLGPATTARTRMILIAPLCAVTLAIGGCNTSRLPPKLSAAEAHEIQGMHYRCVVSVEDYQPHVYAEDLATKLAATRLFAAVVIGDDPKAAYVARVHTPVYGTPTIPILSIMTLGIIPTVVDETFGNIFTLSPAANPQNQEIVDTSYRSTTVLGWVAIPMWAFTRQSVGGPEDKPRFRDRLTLRVVRAMQALDSKPSAVIAADAADEARLAYEAPTSLSFPTIEADESRADFDTRVACFLSGHKGGWNLAVQDYLHGFPSRDDAFLDNYYESHHQTSGKLLNEGMRPGYREAERRIALSEKAVGIVRTRAVLGRISR